MPMATGCRPVANVPMRVSDAAGDGVGAYGGILGVGDHGEFAGCVDGDRRRLAAGRERTSAQRSQDSRIDGESEDVSAGRRSVT